MLTIGEEREHFGYDAIRDEYTNPGAPKINLFGFVVWIGVIILLVALS